MPTAGYDLAIIGGGLVGLATAMELLVRHPALTLVVLEKESQVARHQSGHNSGVLHGGIYYAPGSMKATACVAGKARLIEFCAEHGIPFDLVGKLIVATSEDELPRLETLYQRGIANGVPGLRMVGPEELREIEPHCTGIRAIHSPKTGIIDFTLVARAYAQQVTARGGEIRLNHEVTDIRSARGRYLLGTSGGDVEADAIVSCAGLYADRVARLTGAPDVPRIVPFRGDYYMLRPELSDRVRGMIYPVPDPRFPFLGVHFTRRINGDVWLGPNAVLAFAREGYGRFDLDLNDLRDALSFPGFQKLAAKFWRTGLEEYYRDFSKRAFLAALQRYMPDLAMADLIPGPSGVRAQALGADGALVDDFVVHQQGRALHVRNAPSPAATSSLAIADLIADRASQVMGLEA